LAFATTAIVDFLPSTQLPMFSMKKPSLQPSQQGFAAKSRSSIFQKHKVVIKV
jgi:hypothetical protein